LKLSCEVKVFCQADAGSGLTVLCRVLLLCIIWGFVSAACTANCQGKC